MKAWTTKEIKEAAGMWKAGRSAAEIAKALDRGEQSIKHKIRLDRETFPERNETRTGARQVSIKFGITPLLYRALKDEAARRNVSMNKVIKGALRDRFLAKRIP